MEQGYCIAPRYRGRGLASHALRALTAFEWTLPDVQRIELHIEPWNVASERTAQVAGYQRAPALAPQRYQPQLVRRYHRIPDLVARLFSDAASWRSLIDTVAEVDVEDDLDEP